MTRGGGTCPPDMMSHFGCGRRGGGGGGENRGEDKRGEEGREKKKKTTTMHFVSFFPAQREVLPTHRRRKSFFGVYTPKPWAIDIDPSKYDRRDDEGGLTFVG